nr:dimethylsulfonioproprionate lyase family protein [Rhodopseudomonas rhenobacensis]
MLAALGLWFADQTGVSAEAAEEIRSVESRLAGLATQPANWQPTGHPLTRHLPLALDLADRVAPNIATALRPLAARLPWRYGYAPRSDAAGLENAMGWAELIGPVAPIVSSEVCFGLTLIGPHSFYPPHRHPAVELYRVVVGHPEWTVGSDSAVLAPGSAILHRSNVVHAMRTDHEPLLAIYSWSGDVETSSIWA